MLSALSSGEEARCRALGFGKLGEKMSKRSGLTAGAAALVMLALSGCAAPNFTFDQADPGQRAAAGAVVGASSGALIGGAIGGWEGAGIGAAAGGVVGAVTGAATTPTTPAQASAYPAYSPPPPAPTYSPYPAPVQQR
jgi:hypothetical protein